jgi:ABC-type microcin C transport system permease subunit YejB
MLWPLARPVLKMTVLGLRLIVLLTRSGFLRSLANRIGGKVAEFEQQEYLFRHVFPWAIEKAKARYPTA